jgi:hypothetical protein
LSIKGFGKNSGSGRVNQEFLREKIKRENLSIWIIGSYNPIFDNNGQPYKLIKYVLDITRQKELEQELHIALGTAQVKNKKEKPSGFTAAITPFWIPKGVLIKWLNMCSI